MKEIRRTASATPEPSGDIEVVDVCKSFGGPNVVTGVSFAIRRGELLTLLGPSGSGKTTILMMVAGFERPSSGDIVVNGRSVLNVEPQHRNLGIVFQGYALFPHMSVQENVEFSLRMRKISRTERQRIAHEMLERVGLARFAGNRPRQLSGGQQQRVALARALVFHPAALLLDEPLGALDKRLRETLQLELKAIQRRLGVSVLYVTHDQEEAMAMSDRIAVMQDGRLLQIGPPQDVYDHPVNSFVATFLGETNLIDCDLVSSDSASTRLRLHDGSYALISTPPTHEIGVGYLLAIRPDKVRFVGSDRECANKVIGDIVSRTFLGADIRYTIRAMRQDVVVRARASETQAYTPGTRVTLAWAPEDSQLLPA
jgi:putative spermidine/putrescine transport system ATP-binding protein